MDTFWRSRCRSNHVNLSNMIGTLASGANTSLVAKNGTKKTFQTLQFSIAILRYLEGEIDYRLFILFLGMLFQNYAQEVPSWLDQYWLRDGNYCDFPITLWKMGPKAPRIAWRAVGAQIAPKPSAGARRRAAVCPELKISQYFLAPMGVLPKFNLLKKIANVTLSKKYYKNIFLEI